MRFLHKLKAFNMLVIAACFMIFGGMAAHAVNPQADIVFIIDESGSMGGEIAAVKNNVNFIANQLGASLDPKFALVEFGGQSSGPGNPGLTTDLTDAAGLTAALNTLVASGSYEPGVLATKFAHDSVSWRQGAGVCYVLITDENSDTPNNLAATVNDLQLQNATWFGIIIPGSDNTNYGPNAGSLSQATSGALFNINNFTSNPQGVLTELNNSCIGSIVEGINLTPASDVNPTGTTHTVTATVQKIVNNQPVPIVGVTVTFVITSGPNAGDNGMAVTNANGEATFTYTGDGGEGTDIIEGSFVDSNGDTQRDETPAEKLWDGTPPVCVLQQVIPAYPPPPAIPTTPTTLEVFTQDTGSGIASYTVLVANNATVHLPPTGFTVGTTAPMIVTATKDVEGLSAQVQLEVKDRAGNSTICDPIITTVIRENGKPVSETHNHVPYAESQITVENGTPGLKNLEILVNGDKYQVAGLKDGDVITIDVSGSMVEGDDNTMILTAKGKPGTSALIVIWDGITHP